MADGEGVGWRAWEEVAPEDLADLPGDDGEAVYHLRRVGVCAQMHSGFVELKTSEDNNLVWITFDPPFTVPAGDEVTCIAFPVGVLEMVDKGPILTMPVMHSRPIAPPPAPNPADTRGRSEEGE